MQNWAADTVERRSVSALIPYARNSRTHSDEQVGQIAASIKEWGWTTPVLIADDGVIIAGHGRILAAQKLGIEDVPVMVASGWTDAQKQAYVIADNKLAENAGWDTELLAVEMQELDALDFDLSLIGFDKDALADLTAVQVEGLTDEDDVPELQEDTVSVLGDIWLLGNHRLMCGDSTSIDAVEKLMDGQKADMVFTDPPYGIDYSGGRTGGKSKPAHGKIKNDDLQGLDLGNLISNMFLASKPEADAYVCVSPVEQGPFLDQLEVMGKKPDAVIVWDKRAPGLGYMAYRRQCEFILFCKGSAFRKGDKSDFDLWSISKHNTSDYVHGTQKPVGVPSRGIENSSKGGDCVLDLFGGSGSTLIACEKLGRHARLMELDEKYVDVIIRRWQEFTGREAVHAETGKTFAEHEAA